MKRFNILVVLLFAAFVLSSAFYAEETAGQYRPIGTKDRRQLHHKKISKDDPAASERNTQQGKHFKAKKEDRQTQQQSIQEKVQNRIDRREANQQKRIQQGINKGYLTEEEVNKLKQQQSAITELEKTSFADGKLTKDEAKEIKNAIQEASRCIWAEKHDSEGNQMPVYRLGKNVFAKDSLTSQLNSDNFSEEQAKSLLKDFKSLTELKKKLATEDLSDEERSKLQSEYDNLLNQYFEVK